MEMFLNRDRQSRAVRTDGSWRAREKPVEREMEEMIDMESSVIVWAIEAEF